MGRMIEDIVGDKVEEKKCSGGFIRYHNALDVGQVNTAISHAARSRLTKPIVHPRRLRFSFHRDGASVSGQVLHRLR